MNEFWSNAGLQYVTILISFVPLLVALRAWRRYEASRVLSDQSRSKFRKLCGEALAQYVIALGAPVLYAVIQTLAGNQDLTSNLANAYLTAVALTGLASLWNVYKVSRDTRAAAGQPCNNARMTKLRDVEKTNLSGYTAALVSFLGGTIGLIAYNLLLSPPLWSWFVAFLLTVMAAYGLLWSTAVATVADAYESNPALGRKTRR